MNSGTVCDRQRRIDDEHERRLHVIGDRHEVGQRVERPLLEQRRPDRHDGAGRHRERVAVGRALEDAFAGDDAGAAGPIVDDHRLAEALRQLVGIETHQRVHPGARRQRHDDGDGPSRVVVGMSGLERVERGEPERRCERERAAACAQPRHVFLPRWCFPPLRRLSFSARAPTEGGPRDRAILRRFDVVKQRARLLRAGHARAEFAVRALTAPGTPVVSD